MSLCSTPPWDHLWLLLSRRRSSLTLATTPQWGRPLRTHYRSSWGGSAYAQLHLNEDKWCIATLCPRFCWRLPPPYPHAALLNEDMIEKRWAALRVRWPPPMDDEGERDSHIWELVPIIMAATFMTIWRNRERERERGSKRRSEKEMNGALLYLGLFIHHGTQFFNSNLISAA